MVSESDAITYVEIETEVAEVIVFGLDLLEREEPSSLPVMTVTDYEEEEEVERQLAACGIVAGSDTILIVGFSIMC